MAVVSPTPIIACVLMYAQILSTPGGPTLWTDDGFLAYPGRVRVVHADLESEEKIRETLQKYDLTCPTGSETYDEEEQLIGRATTCTVEKGHEKFWLSALASEPGIGRVELLPLTSASTSNETLPVTFRRQAPTGTAVVRAANATELLADFLTQHYGAKAKASVVKRTERYVEMRVVGLRGTVVPQENLWERLTIRAALVGSDEASRVYLVVDGAFAHGRGRREPAADRYEDMTGSYDSDLERHVGALTNTIAERFKGQS